MTTDRRKPPKTPETHAEMMARMTRMRAQRRCEGGPGRPRELRGDEGGEKGVRGGRGEKQGKGRNENTPDLLLDKPPKRRRGRPPLNPIVRSLGRSGMGVRPFRTHGKTGRAIALAAAIKAGRAPVAEVAALLRSAKPIKTLKQDRFADAIVGGARTQAEAARIAGYDGKDMMEIGRDAAQHPGMLAAIALKSLKTLEKRDKARAIYERAAGIVDGELSRNAEPMYALAAWKTSADVMDKVGAIDGEHAPQEATAQQRLRAAYEMLRAVRGGVRMALRYGPQAALASIEAVIERAVRGPQHLVISPLPVVCPDGVPAQSVESK